MISIFLHATNILKLFSNFLYIILSDNFLHRIISNYIELLLNFYFLPF